MSRITGVLAPRATVPHRAPSSSGGANPRILFDLLDRTRSVPGDIAECGVWRGRSLIAMGLYLKQAHSSKTVWGFDSFEGFSEPVAHKFKDTSLRLVQEKTQIFRLSNVQIVPGFFPDSFAGVKDKAFSFVHIDCDIYESYRVCLEFFYPRVSSGGILLFDEYNDPEWQGANQAVDEFCKEKGIAVQEILIDNFRKSYLQKP